MRSFGSVVSMSGRGFVKGKVIRRERKRIKREAE